MHRKRVTITFEVDDDGVKPSWPYSDPVWWAELKAKVFDVVQNCPRIAIPVRNVDFRYEVL